MKPKAPPFKRPVFEEPIPDDVPAADLSENARIVLAKRYLKKDAEGTPTEEPEAMFWRVAKVIANADLDYGASEAAVEELARQFYDLMTTGKFEPNSPTLMNAGRPLGQLSACFVLPVDDTLSNGKSGIYDTLKAMALVHQSGGGTGFSFSRIRPTGSQVRSTTGVASGPVSFMTLYDASTEVVKQGGTRRGANMGILRVDHPDIRSFIACKDDTSRITNFNISVALTDAFMESVEAGESYDLVNPKTREVVGQEDAREIFDLIIHGAWKTGEPGTFFIDRANKFNPVPKLGSYEATNPCGEQPLLPYDVCNLGSLNLAQFVKADHDPGSDPADGVDWEALRQTVHLSTHFLDNVIDANQYPLQEIADLAQTIRRIGLGVMGWADMLIGLGIPYDSAEGVEMAGKVMGFLNEEARKASEKLAKDRGPFPAWKESIWGPDQNCVRDSVGHRIRPMRRLRNCNLTTVAPTGTISIFAGCSGGIEPIFAVAFMRNQAGAMMPDVNPVFVARAQAEGWYSEELMARIAEEGHIHFPEVPDEVQAVFKTAHDISPEWHVRMQAAFQEHTDSAISKTTNFPTQATEDDVRKIYQLAYELDCKGVTVYRDGSRSGQVLSTGKTGKTAETEESAESVESAELEESAEFEELGESAELEESGESAESGEPGASAELEEFGASAELGESAESEALGASVEDREERSGDVVALEQMLADARESLHVLQMELDQVHRERQDEDRTAAAARHKRQRPPMLRGRTLKMSSPLGDLYVTINEDEAGHPFEVFCTLGKAGGAATADAEAVGRLISLALRSGIPVSAVKDQLRGVSSDRAVGVGPSKVLSLPDAIGQAIERYLAEMEGVQETLPLGVVVEAGGAQAQTTSGGGAHANFLGSCPECGAGQLSFEEGCVKCHICGYSQCA